MSVKKNRAVFFDRDGVLNSAIIINGKPSPPLTIEEVNIIENGDNLLYKLVDAGFILIGITNQPDVARGTQTREMVESINQYLMSKLPLKEIKVCYHDDKDYCDCRKPKPGLIFQAAKEYNIDLSCSFLVGDRWRDVEAGLNAGLKTIWINNGYNEKTPDLKNVKEVFSLKEAVNFILENTR